MSCVTCEPKSTMRILSWIMCGVLWGAGGSGSSAPGAVVGRHAERRRGPRLFLPCGGGIEREVHWLRRYPPPDIASRCPPPHKGGGSRSCRLGRWRSIRSSPPAPQHCDEEPVGVGAQRRHQQALVGETDGAAEQERALAERGNYFGRRHDGQSLVSREKSADLGAVLLVQHRAGGIDDASTRLDERRRAIEHRD